MLVIVTTIDYLHPFVGAHGDMYLLVWASGTIISLLINLYVERILLLGKIKKQKENLHGLKNQYKLDQKEIQQLSDLIGELKRITIIRERQVATLSKQLPPTTAQYIQNEVIISELTKEANRNV